MDVTLTEQQFFDYMACPAMFEMKYIKKIPISEPISTPKLLSKIAKYFYINLLNGKICTNNELKRKWDSICQSHEGEITSKQVMDGISFIMKLALWAQNQRLVVLDMDTRYNIRVGDTELVGNLGTILSAPNNQYELLITDFSSRMPDQTLINMKLKYTLDAYAFNKVHGKFVDGVKVHSVKFDKDFFSSRTDGDFKRLETAIRNVGKSITEGLYYPREGMCSTCTGKDFCKYWYC